MDGFGDNFDQGDIDPAAEFLAREQDQLAGLEDELNSVNLGAAPANDDGFAPESNGSFEMINNIGNQDGFEVNGLGSDRGSPPAGTMTHINSADYAKYILDEEDSSPDVCEVRSVGPRFSKPVAGLRTQSVLQSQSLHQSGTVILEQRCPEAPQLDSSETAKPPVRAAREEPEQIKRWREEQLTRLQDKDANEEKRKAELRDGAKKELEDWYTHHEELIAKTKASNRNAEKLFVAETEEIVPGTEWERIAKLCDFNPKSSKTNKDVSRMRSIILQLKQAPPPARA